MQTKATDKPTRGRPKKFIDLELVEKLGAIQCTYPEVASALGVSIDTLTRHKDFAATFKRGAEGGRKSLRRMQFESANRGNVAMQIWLGKQYLGQSDHVVKEIRRITSMDDLSNEELHILIAAGGNVAAVWVSDAGQHEAGLASRRPNCRVEAHAGGGSGV